MYKSLLTILTKCIIVTFNFSNTDPPKAPSNINIHVACTANTTVESHGQSLTIPHNIEAELIIGFNFQTLGCMILTVLEFISEDHTPVQITFDYS